MNTLAQLSDLQIFIIVLAFFGLMTILVSAFFRGSKDIPDDLVVKSCKLKEEATHAETVEAQNIADGIIPPK